MMNKLGNTVMRLSSLLLIIGFSIAIFISVGNDTIATASPLTSGDSSPVAAIITITEDNKQNTVFIPKTTNITQGEEIFIGNNSSSPQSITSGTGPEDPLSGKLFDTGIIKSKGYAEFVTANLDLGPYPYYSSTNPSAQGSIIIQK